MFAIREGEPPSSKPRWGWLYGIVMLLGSLMTVIEVALPDGVARRALEFAVTLAILGAMALWVRANRVALALANEDHPSRTVTYNRRWRWTIVGVIPKRSWSARARKKPGSTVGS